MKIWVGGRWWWSHFSPRAFPPFVVLFPLPPLPFPICPCFTAPTFCSLVCSSFSGSAVFCIYSVLSKLLCTTPPFLAATAHPALDINQMDLLVMLDKQRNIFIQLLIKGLFSILDKSMLMFCLFVFLLCLSVDPPALTCFCLNVFLPTERSSPCAWGKECHQCVPHVSVLYRFVYALKG